MPVEPQPAATLLLLRDGAAGLEVLMIERHRNQFFSRLLPDYRQSRNSRRRQLHLYLRHRHDIRRWDECPVGLILRALGDPTTDGFLFGGTQ